MDDITPNLTIRIMGLPVNLTYTIEFININVNLFEFN